jgi:hypothetical protein
LWLGALAASLTLVVVQLLLFYGRAVAKNTKFFWLLPYPGTVGGMLALMSAVAKRAPLIAVALFVIPSIALVVTLYWMVGT